MTGVMPVSVTDPPNLAVPVSVVLVKFAWVKLIVNEVEFAVTTLAVMPFKNVDVVIFENVTMLLVCRVFGAVTVMMLLVQLTDVMLKFAPP
jgi:hypothetical protein